jgi:Flp pilus assembly protein TadB
MDASLIMGIIAGFFAIASAMVLIYFFFSGRSQASHQNLMSSGSSWSAPGDSRSSASEEIHLDKIKFQTRKAAEHSSKQKITFDERLFRAGVFTPKQRAEIRRMQVIAPPLMAILVGSMCWINLGSDMGLMGILLGAAVGLQLPFTILDRRYKARMEEIMFYLPLVVEQISIGVSSSLDIGPCLQRVVQMADERDTHNVVTELLGNVQYHIKSGMSTEEALNEMGRLSGSNELKHTFVSLAQVSKHGGEISKQLQELADAVSSQRETQIEAKIKKLELEATGPVALVFAGFMGVLLIGFGLQIQGAFG